MRSNPHATEVESLTFRQFLRQTIKESNDQAMITTGIGVETTTVTTDKQVESI